MNYIIRPVWRRPHIFFKSIVSEIEARKYWNPLGDYTTVFLLDYDYDKRVLAMVEEYPHKKEIVERDKKYHFSNIILGIDKAMEDAEDHVIVIVEDIILHKSYFAFMDKVLNMDLGKYSAVVSHNRHYRGHQNAIFKGNRFLDWGSLIKKDFYMKYVKPGLNRFIATPQKFLHDLDKEYQDYYPFPYLYKDDYPPEHFHQDGYWRRACNIARIKENLPVITPAANRSLHIGFYGKNRSGHRLKGKSFEEKLYSLDKLIELDLLYKASLQKEYKDYFKFEDKLEDWRGELTLIGFEGE